MSEFNDKDYQPVVRHRRTDRYKYEDVQEVPEQQASPSESGIAQDPVVSYAAPVEPSEPVNAFQPAGETLPEIEDMRDAYTAPAGQPSYQGYAPYSRDDREDLQRRRLQQPPQSTDVYTKMTETGYQQTIHQQARPSYQGDRTAVPYQAAEQSQEQTSARQPVYTRPTTRTTVRPEQADEAYQQRMQRRRMMETEETENQQQNEDEEDERTPVWRIILIVAVFIVAMLIGIYFLLPEGDTGIIGSLNKVKSSISGTVGKVKGIVSPTAGPAQVIEFKVVSPSGVTGSKCVYNLTTSKNVTEIRLVDQYDDEVICNVTRQDIDNSSYGIWELSTVVDQPYQGKVYAQVRSGDGEWNKFEQGIELNYVDATPTPAPIVETPTPAPTNVPVKETPVVEVPVFTLPDVVIPTETEIPKETKEPEIRDNEPIDETSDDIFDDEGAYVEDNGDELPDNPTEEDPDGFNEEPYDNEWPDDEYGNDEIPDDEYGEYIDEYNLPDDDMIDDWDLNEDEILPEETPTLAPIPTMAPTEAPVTPTPMPALTASSDSTSLKMTDTVYIGAKSQSSYQRKNSLTAVNPDNYSYAKSGILTFRGDSFRRNASFSTVEIAENKMSVLWSYDLGSIKTKNNGTLYGFGWNNQAAIVKWSSEIREMMNINAEKKATTALKEVIFTSLDGKVYFLDVKDGQPTRDPIDVGYPLRSAVSVDTRARPMIAFGQSVSILPKKTGPIGYYLYNLIDCSELMFINGRKTDNQKQYSTNGAFDASGLFLWNNDAMIVAGSNGLLYTVDLNADFKYKDEVSLTVNPSTVYLRSKANNSDDSSVTVEGSLAMYDKYVFMADRYGALRCIDTDTMRTVWAFDNGDNTSATIALDFDDAGNLWLYTGNCNTSRIKKKDNTIRRINAMTGEVDWEYTIKCTQDSKNRDSGCKASPVIGENSIDHLVFFTVNKVSEGGSKLIALNKETGKVQWEYSLTAEAVSSPVAVYNEAGDSWIIQADESGLLHMFDARSGAHLSELDLGGEIQGSPAVYKDILVIGTCSKEPKMYGIKLE